MTRKAKILILLFSLILPYMAFAMYLALTLRGNTLPLWFPYAALCYLVVAASVFIVGRKRIVASTPPPGVAEQTKQNLSGARALRRLGYIWLIGPLFYLLDGGPRVNPAWVTILGFSWVGFLSWFSFRQANKMELKARQNLP
jgi:hypothetical protein